MPTIPWLDTFGFYLSFCVHLGKMVMIAWDILIPPSQKRDAFCLRLITANVKHFIFKDVLACLKGKASER